MELDIWRGDWGLPSVDTDCLRILTFMKICGAPVKVCATSNPFKTPKGSLPVLRDGKEKISGYDAIINYIDQKGYKISEDQLGQQNSQIEAYYMHLENKLLPGLLYVWWVDAKNYVQFTRSWYAKALPFPLNYIYPGRYERNAVELLEVLHGEEVDAKQREESVYSEAQRCITLLSSRLGESTYFFGSEPSIIDATIFGYLAPLLRAPLPSAALKNHLQMCPNLVKYINRIAKLYYPDLDEDYFRQLQEKEAEQRAKENIKKTKTTAESSDLDDFPNKGRSLFLAGLVSLTAMAGYAFATGILQISSINNNGFPEDIFDDDDDGGN